MAESAVVEKEHVTFAIGSFLSVIQAAGRTETLPHTLAKSLHERGDQLLKQVEEKKVESLVAAREVRNLIQEFNRNIPKWHAAYPPFTTDFLETHVKNQVIAFELFLNHKLKSDQLTHAQESQLFNDSLIIWRDVGRKMTPKEAIVALSKLIQKANSFLPESDRFPLPDHQRY